MVAARDVYALCRLSEGVEAIQHDVLVGRPLPVVNQDLGHEQQRRDQMDVVCSGVETGGTEKQEESVLKINRIKVL